MLEKPESKRKRSENPTFDDKQRKSSQNISNANLKRLNSKFDPNAQRKRGNSEHRPTDRQNHRNFSKSPNILEKCHGSENLPVTPKMRKSSRFAPNAHRTYRDSDNQSVPPQERKTFANLPIHLQKRITTCAFEKNDECCYYQHTIDKSCLLVKLDEKLTEDIIKQRLQTIGDTSIVKVPCKRDNKTIQGCAVVCFADKLSIQKLKDNLIELNLGPHAEVRSVKGVRNRILTKFYKKRLRDIERAKKLLGSEVSQEELFEYLERNTKNREGRVEDIEMCNISVDSDSVSEDLGIDGTITHMPGNQLRTRDIRQVTAEKLVGFDINMHIAANNISRSQILQNCGAPANQSAHNPPNTGQLVDSGEISRKLESCKKPSSSSGILSNNPNSDDDHAKLRGYKNPECSPGILSNDSSRCENQDPNPKNQSAKTDLKSVKTCAANGSILDLNKFEKEGSEHDNPRFGNDKSTPRSSYTARERYIARVTNFSPKTYMYDFTEFLKKNDAVKCVRIPQDKDTGKKRGVAYVEFETQSSLETFLDKRIFYENRKLIVSTGEASYKIKDQQKSQSHFPKACNHSESKHTRSRFEPAPQRRLAIPGNFRDEPITDPKQYDKSIVDAYDSSGTTHAINNDQKRIERLSNSTESTSQNRPHTINHPRSDKSDRENRRFSKKPEILPKNSIFRQINDKPRKSAKIVFSSDDDSDQATNHANANHFQRISPKAEESPKSAQSSIACGKKQPEMNSDDHFKRKKLNAKCEISSAENIIFEKSAPKPNTPEDSSIIHRHTLNSENYRNSNGFEIDRLCKKSNATHTALTRHKQHKDSNHPVQIKNKKEILHDGEACKDLQYQSNIKGEFTSDDRTSSHTETSINVQKLECSDSKLDELNQCDDVRNKIPDHPLVSLEYPPATSGPSKDQMLITVRTPKPFDRTRGSSPNTTKRGYSTSRPGKIVFEESDTDETPLISVDQSSKCSKPTINRECKNNTVKNFTETTSETNSGDTSPKSLKSGSMFKTGEIQPSKTGKIVFQDCNSRETKSNSLDQPTKIETPTSNIMTGEIQPSKTSGIRSITVDTDPNTEKNGRINKKFNKLRPNPRSRDSKSHASRKIVFQDSESGFGLREFEKRPTVKKGAAIVPQISVGLRKRDDSVSRADMETLYHKKALGDSSNLSGLSQNLEYQNTTNITPRAFLSNGSEEKEAGTASKNSNPKRIAASNQNRFPGAEQGSNRSKETSNGIFSDKRSKKHKSNPSSLNPTKIIFDSD